MIEEISMPPAAEKKFLKSLKTGILKELRKEGMLTDSQLRELLSAQEEEVRFW